MGNTLLSIGQTIAQTTGWDVVAAYNNMPSFRPSVENLDVITNKLSEVSARYSGTQIGLMSTTALLTITIVPTAIYKGVQALKAGEVRKAVGIMVLGTAATTGCVAALCSTMLNPAGCEETNPLPKPNPAPQLPNSDAPIWNDVNGTCVPNRVGVKLIPIWNNVNGTCVPTGQMSIQRDEAYGLIKV